MPFSAGLITESDTAGLNLAFGNAENYSKVIDYIVQGTTEFFQDLQKGAEYCAHKYGGEDFAICFGGLESPGYINRAGFYRRIFHVLSQFSFV